MAKHASIPGLQVYHAASSEVNPYYYSDFGRFVEEYFQEQPFLDSRGNPIKNFKFQFYPDIQSSMEALLQDDAKSKVYSILIYVLKTLSWLAGLHHIYDLLFSQTAQLWINVKQQE